MLTLECYDPATGATRGFLALNETNDRARRVPSCDKASHFLSTTTAALVKERYKADLTPAGRVVTCICPVGQHYRAVLRPT